MSDFRQSHRYLQIKTCLGDDAVILTRANGHERLGGLFEIAAEFFCQSGNLDLDALLGTAATITVNNAPAARKGSVGHSRSFHGYFSRIAFAGYDNAGRARFRATLVPWLWFLTRKADCRIFQQKSVPEILELVFKSAGFSDFKKNLRDSYPPREFCVQYRETDFNFVSRLMECEGIYYYFEHEEGSHKLVLCDAMVCHKKSSKHELIRFIGGAEGRDTRGVITDWNFVQEIKPGKFAHNDFNFTAPTPDPNHRLLARSSAPAPQKPAPFEIYDNLGGYGTLSEGNRYARLRMEELISDRDTAQARTDLTGMKAGYRFTLAKHPLGDQNREYLVTAVNWVAAEGSYGSGSTGGGDFFDCDFSCIPADATFRPLRATPLPKIEGPQTATVCGPSGQEIYVDDHARVKVQFHWDRYGKSDAASSCWIRVSQPWAGGSFGAMAIPRIGHEVIVEFIEADPDRPIITGRVYNGSNKPHASNAGRDGKPGNSKPSGIPAAAMMTSFKSNSLGGSGGHNEITMNDAGGAEGLFIKAQKDEIHNVGNDREDTVGNNETRKVGVDRSREVGNNETVKVGVNRSMDVGVNHTETVGSNQSITVGSNQSIKVGSNQSVTVGSNKTETVAIACAESIGAVKALTIGVGYQVTVGASMNTSVALTQTEQIGLIKHTLVGSKYVIDVGSASITIDASGKVTIKGTEFLFEASGPVKINGSVVDIN